MRRVVHRHHVFPIVGPAFHVLRMRGLHVLDLAKLAGVVKLLDIQVFAAVDDGFGHHVLETGLAHERDDFLGLLDRRRHRHGADDVLARLEGGDRHGGMVGDRAVDVDDIDLRIGQDFTEIGVAVLDPELVADLIEMRLCALGDRRDLSIRMRLIDGNELRTETKPDDADAYLFHGILPCLVGWSIGTIPGVEHEHSREISVIFSRPCGAAKQSRSQT